MSRQAKVQDEPNHEELSGRTGSTLARRQLGAGRVGAYTVLGAASGIVPLPWVPDLLARRVRGALAHDIVARHGLSLTPEARAIFAEPSGTEGPRGIIAQGVVFVSTKVLGRLGPLGVLPPIRSAVSTFMLGHLLQRYLETARTDRAVRIDVEEARRVRRAIDQAMIYALTTETHSPRENKVYPPEDLRDQVTQMIDGVLIAFASAPGWLIRRIETAFDEVLPSVRA